MSIKRNIFKYIVISLILITGFSSCGKNKSSANPPNATLTLALRKSVFSEVIKKQIGDFEKENNVVCKILELEEDDLHQKVVTSLPNFAGNYDLCMVDGSWAAECKAKKIMTNLYTFGYSLDDDIIPATTTISVFDGGLYLVPYGGNVTVLLYNKLFVKEAGYTPETIDSLEDIMKICEFTKKRHGLGFMFRGDTANNIVVDFLPILRSFGGWVVDENNRPTVNNAIFDDAFNFYIELIKTGRAAKKDDLIAAIANKSAAVGIGWPGWYTPTNNSSMDYIALTGKRSLISHAYNANIYGIWTLGVPENSPNKEYAVKLLKYLMDPERQKASVDLGGVPCRYSSLKDPEILAKFPQYDAVRKALEKGVYRPVMEQWTDFYKILGKHMNLAIQGQETVEEALFDAQRELELKIANKQ